MDVSEIKLFVARLLVCTEVLGIPICMALAYLAVMIMLN